MFVQSNQRATFLLAFALTLTFAPACGDDDDDDTGTDTSSTDTSSTDTSDATNTSDDDDDNSTSDDDDDDTGTDDDDDVPVFAYDVPLEAGSPWPKFRRTPEQTGRSPIARTVDGASTAQPWVFKTGKGIFSTPVVAADGTVYIGSADRNFYAINPDGTEKWRFVTGEIIDSSALLDDTGRVYFGSGDGNLYALDAATGNEAWRFTAEDPTTTNAIINWFEGNVAIGPDGTLYAGNDNFRIYAINRDDGSMKWAFKAPDQTWSLPAVDPATGNLYVGNNSLLNILGDNVFAITPGGKRRWSAGTNGTIAASPLLTQNDLVALGGYDGFLRAYDTASGDLAWEFGARDHIYASPAELADGTIIQPAADGTVYAINPGDGTVVWAYDTLDPIRGSPAVDGNGTIYVGTGGGALLALNSDGTLRWKQQLIVSERDDLNASPALGIDSIYIAGESGEVFGIPYDFCLRESERDNPACETDGGEPLADDGALLFFTSPFGKLSETIPFELSPYGELTFSFFLREDGDNALAFIDTDSLTVETTATIDLLVEISADRRFFTVRPATSWPTATPVTLTITGDYLTNATREGLKFEGGTKAGSFTRDFEFTVENADLPLPGPFPVSPGDLAAVWELARLAAPNPTILPSYNQIGFDSLHYIIGTVEGYTGRGVAWAIGATVPEGATTPIPDPNTKAMFPLAIEYGNGSIRMENQSGFTLEALSATLSFERFTLAAVIGENLAATAPPSITVAAVCEELVYGPFLRTLGFCNPETDRLVASAGADLNPLGSGIHTAPEGLGTVAITRDANTFTATLTGSTLLAAEHHTGILLIDGKTNLPITVSYGEKTTRTEATGGTIATVTLDATDAEVADFVRAYLMVDAYPAAVQVFSPEQAN